MKSVLTRLALTFSLLFLILSSVAGAPPKLEPISGEAFATRVSEGQPMSFSMTYHGDPPTSLLMIVQTPTGETIRIPTKPSVGDPTSDKGVTATWPFTPSEVGTYHYHFEAVAGDIGGVSFPDDPKNNYEIAVINPVLPFIIAGAGLFVSLLLLPFISYTATRNINKRGDPATAARVALVVGLVVYIGLIVCIFAVPGFDYKWLGWALAAMIILSVLVGLLTRRRAV